LTVQIDDGQLLAARLNLPVAYDFHAADVAAGGQGAPLVPLFHQTLARELRRPPSDRGALNFGGVANVTFVDGGDPIAFDNGPGDALLNGFMRARTGAPDDNHGDVAATGKPDQVFIDRVLADSFFTLTPVKSHDRNSFAFANIGLPNYSVPDGAATLSSLTIQTVGLIVPKLPAVPKSWVVTGGGAGNRTLVNVLKERLAPATVETANEADWSANALEAQAFASLEVRVLKGLPYTFPASTGVSLPMAGGIVARP
jgi:anhydro-N-acetylmuramic acid kinase